MATAVFSPETMYPVDRPQRDRWILERRPARSVVNPWRPNAYLIEQEPTAGGELAEVTTIFLTGRECPWRCLMCDLWQHTTEERTPVGAIPAQIDFALTELGSSRREEALESLRKRTPDESVSPGQPVPAADSDGPFPLTPALSPREREPTRQHVENAKRFDPSNAVGGMPPLLGERAGVRGNETHELAGETINSTGRTAHPRQLKLYNSGSFFDRAAVPIEDYEPIARRAAGFERVVVESHPSLIGDLTLRFRDLLAKIAATGIGNPLSPFEGERGPTVYGAQGAHNVRGILASVLNGGEGRGEISSNPDSRLEPPNRRSPPFGVPASAGPAGKVGGSRDRPKPGLQKAIHGDEAPTTAINAAPQLEVAMGLETAHPGVLEKLNKRVTLDQFARAAAFLKREGIALRVFVLVKPPFMDEDEALEWAVRSTEFAFDCGAGVVSLIPTRFGNGALEALAAHGQFAPPRLATLEAALERGLGLKRGRVFADVWDLEKFSNCPACLTARRERLELMNLQQTRLPPVYCERCS